MPGPTAYSGHRRLFGRFEHVSPVPEISIRNLVPSGLEIALFEKNNLNQKLRLTSGSVFEVFGFTFGWRPASGPRPVLEWWWGRGRAATDTTDGRSDWDADGRDAHLQLSGKQIWRATIERVWRAHVCVRKPDGRLIRNNDDDYDRTKEIRHGDCTYAFR